MKCSLPASVGCRSLIGRIVTMCAALFLGLSVIPGTVAAQEEPTPDESDLDELIAGLTPFRCPILPSMNVDVARPLPTITGVTVNGLIQPPPTLRIRCNYRPSADVTAGLAAIVFDFSIRAVEPQIPCAAEATRDQNDGLTVSDVYARPGFDIRVGYRIEAAALAVVPELEAEIVGAYEVQLAALEPFASACRPDPVEVTCPTIVDMTLGEPRPTEDRGFFRASCFYDIADEGRQTQITVTWASAQAGPTAIESNCSEQAPQIRPRVGHSVVPDRAAMAVWYTTSFEAEHATATAAAADALLALVVEQAAICETVSPFAAPLPPYLEAAFSPDRVDGAPITREPLAPTAADPVVVEEPSVAPDASTTTVSSSAGATSTVPAATEERPAASSPAGEADAVPVPLPSESPSGAWVTALQVASVILLVLSVLGVALALLLMRRRARVRPRFDVARLVIVLTVAVVSTVLLARSAPVWAVVAAVVVGAAIGYVQGANLDLAMVGDNIFATRSRWALMAFVAGLVVTQLAGLLNRTGAITVGLALSFLSAAMTGGLVAGRSPKLVEARRVGAAATIVLVIAAVALAAAVPGGSGIAQSDEPQEPETETESDIEAPDPTVQPETCRTTESGERCVATTHLMSLVDWTQVEFRAGLYADSDKPPFTMSIAPMLESIPEPISQTIEWTSQPPAASQPIQFSATETITFDTNEDGLCCSLLYSGAAERDGTPTSAEGSLHDLLTVGVPFQVLDAIPLGGAVDGLPFSGELDYGFGDATTCVRYIAGTPASMNQNGAFTTYLINGEDRVDDERFVRSAAFSHLTIPCEVPGFSMDAATAMLPPIPSARATGCPTRQELVPVLAEGGLEVTATAMIGQMFLAPNDELCGEGSLIAPMQFGSDRPGATRSEFAFEYGAPDSVTVWGDDSALYTALSPLPSIMPSCEFGASGAPVEITDPEDRCSSQAFHQIDQGWLSISYDNTLSDGPNTTIRASLPWGAYRYRCHHCTPGDPEIARFLGQFNEFSSDWTETLQAAIDDAAAVAPAVVPAGDEEPLNDPIPDVAIDPVDEPTQLEQDAELLGIDPELAELFIDENSDDERARDTALAALVGLMGSLGLAGTALAESGLSPSEMASRFRENGIAGLDDALDEHAALGVVDEYGDTLMPDNDGRYTWDDGDSARQVDRAELEELIGRARDAAGATALDEAARLAEHDRRRNEDWQELRQRVRLQTAQEMSEIDMERDQRERLMRRGERMRDVVEQMDDTPLRDRMLDFFEREPGPSDAEFLAMRNIMRHQESDQRVIDRLGDQSELSMALEGTQRDLARLADLAGQPGLATVIRNPSVPARLAAAYATGGATEMALAPLDLFHALDAKADAVLEAENRNLTTAEIVSEITQAVVIEYLGARLGGAGAEPPPAPRRPMQLLPENYMLQVKPGQKIPLLHQTGYTPRHVQRLTSFAERRGVIPGARTANQYSAAHIRSGAALPKPLDIKPKTLNEIDIHLGAKPEHLGTVGFFDPKMPDTSKMSDELASQVRRRFDARLAEQSKYLDEINANKNLVIRDGRVLDATTGKAFAGDMDLVYLRDAKTGEVITGQRYVDLRNEMIDEGLIEHGAEFNIHADLTEGLTPGTAEYQAALDQADGIAQNVLMPTHMDGAPIMEIRNGVPVRGEDVFMLPVNTT